MKYALLAFAMLLSGPALAQSVPEINFDSVPDYPKLPKGMNFGEVPGVAVNSRGHVYVFTRSNSANGPAYAPAAAQLLEFDPNVAGLDNTCTVSLTTCNPSTDTFGQILNTRAPREIQLGFKFYC